MPDVPESDSPPRSRLAIVKIREPQPGRPRVRFTRVLPDWMTADLAVKLAQTGAREEPGHRFQVLDDQGAGEARVLWDSRAPS